MRRRLLSALTVLAVTSGLMLSTSTGADAAVVTTTTGGVTYQADDTAPGAGASVVSVDATAPKALVLPTTVIINATTYVVTSISGGAAEALDLASLTLPERLVTIGESAFLGNQLSSLVLPSTVTSVGNGAFVANKLTSLSLSSSLQNVGEGAFAGNQLSSLTLPASLRIIDSGAFVSNRITTITIPASVSVIDDAAFADNPLATVVFTGAPPTTFSPATPAGGSPIGSFGDGKGLVVFYPAQFAAPGYPGGFTSPLWKGYSAAAVGATAPTTPPTPTTPPAGTVPGGVAKPTITKVKARRKAGGLTVFKVTVTNLGTSTAQGLRVIIKNRPYWVTYPKPTAVVGALAARATVTVRLRARIRSQAKTKFIFKALSDNAPRSTFRVRLSRR